MEKAPNWAAQFFLVLVPAAVGSLLGSLILDPRGESYGFVISCLSVALIFTLAGVCAPVLGIKKPLRSYRLLAGVRRSPLSRQAVLVGLFALFLLTDWVLALAGIYTLWLGIVTVVLGAAATLAAGMVYLQRAQPAWCHWSTPVALFGGLLALGVSASMVTALGWPEVLLDDTSGGLASRLLVLVGVATLAIAMRGRSTYLQRGGTRTEEARAIAQGEFPWFKAGMALVMIGGIATAASFASDWVIIVAFVGLLAALFVHWRLFFLSAAPLSWRSEIRWISSSPLTGREG